MAGSLSTAADGWVLDFLTGRSMQYTATRTTYLLLCNGGTAPAVGDTLSVITGSKEISGPSAAGYTRQVAPWGAPSGANPNVTANNADIIFGPFTAGVSNVAYAVLTTASSGSSGDVIMIWTLSVAKTAAAGESMKVSSGALTMTLG